MDIVTKVLTALGGIIVAICAVSAIMAYMKLRGGLAQDNSRDVEQGIQGLIVNGAGIALGGGLIATAISLVNGIQF